jgi:hypothetical protein
MNVKCAGTTLLVAAFLSMTVLFAVSPVSAGGTKMVTGNITRDSIYIHKAYSSSKYRVKLYPDADHQVLFFSASGREGKAYQLFVFDLNGKLIKNVNTRNKETTMLENIDKGVYVFEVFSNDERIGNGQLFIR